MASVHTQTKSTRGSERVCGRCGAIVRPGETFYWWKFRYGGKHVRCAAHPPQQWELTQSKMSGIYEAMDAARKEFGTIEETKAAIQTVAEVARDVVEEYRTAAEHFGGGGPNAEKADELEGWVEELEQFEPEDPEEAEFNEDEYREKAEERSELDEITFNEAMQVLRDEWEEEHGEEAENAAEAAREEAEELLNQCPA